MFNFAIISIKDFRKKTIKCIASIIILLIIYIIISNNTKENNIQIDISAPSIKYSFVQCLDICLPKIKLKNEDMEKSDIENFTIRKLLLFDLPGLKISQSNEESIIERDYTIDIPDDVNTKVVENTVPESYSITLEDVNIKNSTDISLTNEMLIDNLEIRNTKNIFIYHTHTCESYTPSEENNYEMTGNFRTTDLNYSVARVGTELEMYLKELGFNVTHDMNYYDYPAYNGSYDRAYDSVKKQLENLEDTEILFDIHRDAIGDSSYAPTVKIGNEYASQMMFVIGSNGGGLEHPNWLYNLSFAVKIQKRANEKYPGLFKPIILRNSRYNQHLAKGACIIEVGATGNTLEQCNNSMKYLADILKEVL